MSIVSFDSAGSKRPFWIALVMALAYLIPALACLGDYGPTYDAIKGDYPYGERLLGYLTSGDERFLELQAREPVPEVRAPHPDFDVGRYPSHWIFPVGSLLSAVSCRIFWTELGLVPAMAAHHLPFVLLSALLVFVVSAFAMARFGVLAGVLAGGALFLTPSFFGHSFNNPKDIPECCFYTFAVLAGFRALESGRVRTWILAGGLAGLALAQKPNALFLPLQLALYVGGAWILARAQRTEAPRLSVRGVLAAAGGFLLVYYAVSPPFWSAPIEGPRRWITQMLAGGSNAFRDDTGDLSREVSLAAPLSVLRTTPLVTLALALVGLLRPGLGARMRWFLGLSLALPIARNLMPGMRNFDGTRHFLEFLPMLALLTGIGAAWLAERAEGFLGETRKRLARPLVGALVLLPGAWAVIATHPNQITYFNALAGGLGGAQASHDPDAADYWGNSYWQGMAWLSAHAEPNSRLLAPHKDFIARCGAPVRLRSDIQLEGARTARLELPTYVMQPVNRGMLPFVLEMNRRLVPLHEIRVQNGAVLRIDRIEDDATGALLTKAWEAGKVDRSIDRALLRLQRKRPDLTAILRKVRRKRMDPEKMLERLGPLLSEEERAEFAEALEDAAWSEDGAEEDFLDEDAER